MIVVVCGGKDKGNALALTKFLEEIFLQPVFN
jgi:hypothetical protein